MEFKVNDRIRFRENIIEDSGLTKVRACAVKEDTGVISSITPTGYYVIRDGHCWSPFFVRPEQIAPVPKQQVVTVMSESKKAKMIAFTYDAKKAVASIKQNLEDNTWKSIEGNISDLRQAIKDIEEGLEFRQMRTLF